MAIVGVGDSHTSAKAELLRAHGCPIPVLADRSLQWVSSGDGMDTGPVLVVPRSTLFLGTIS
jgi:hypothetical protein